MTIGHSFFIASGASKDDCHWLGYRFVAELGFGPEQGDSWVGQTIGSNCYSLLTQPGWMTGLWRTDSRVWVSQVSGQVYMNPSLEFRKEPWQTFRFDASLSGIWGLRDDLVFTWGLRRSDPIAFLYDGTDWREIGVPGHIGFIRGLRDDLIYAVGLRGFIARWNGSAFRAVQGPTDGNLSDIFIVSDDEMYACGNGGHLLKGSVHGWEVLLQHDSPLYCIAKWRDAVWVGGGPQGLFKLVDEALELYKPKVLAESFDARGFLMGAAPNAIFETKDGVDFQGTLLKALEDLSAGQPTPWEEDKEDWDDEYDEDE